MFGTLIFKTNEVIATAKILSVSVSILFLPSLDSSFIKNFKIIHC